MITTELIIFGTSKFNLNGIVHNGVDLSGFEIEAVMPRSEKYVHGSRKPEVQASDLKGDAERRDLTFNALFKNLSTGKILDLTGKGIDDLRNGLIRTPIDPDSTFRDDSLRMLRVVRFYAKYGYKIPLNIIRSLKRNAHELENISSERIQDELNKMLLTTSPDKAIRLLKLTGILKFVLPEVHDLIGVTQNKYHHLDVFDHTMEVLKNSPPRLITRIGALFHDIGKKATRQVVDTSVHFYNHENVGADLARKIMTRLKYPNNVIDAVCLAVKSHMRLKQAGEHGEVTTDKTLRKLSVDLGDHLRDILDIMHADNLGHAEGHSTPNQIPGIIKRLETLKTTIPQKGAKLPLTGEDLKQMGIPASPLYKELLDLVKDRQLESPNTTKEEYITLVQNYLKSKK
jgi:putative nucleotidyltransferase with HDIG domain